jgi:YYY domain-containing protein
MADASVTADMPLKRAERLSLSMSDALVGVLLVLVMLIGGYFRFVGLNWDDFTHLHPDERFLTDVASSIGGPLRSSIPGEAEQQAQRDRCMARYPDTGGVGGYFDADCSTLNPHNAGKGLYVYGTLSLFAARAAGDFMAQMTGDSSLNGYSGVHLVWRSLSAFSEMAIILIVFLIGLELHGRWVGLVAAALYAGAVFSIQMAHFGTADAMTNLFAALALLFAVRVQMRGNLLDYAFFGLAFGAALASRVNIAPLAGLLVLASMLRMMPVMDDNLAAGERWRLIWMNGAGLALAGALSVLVFRIFNPYAFMGPGFFGLTPNERWLADIRQAQYLVSGQAEMPPNWQWVGRTPYLFALNNMVLWGMGIALGFTGLVGWVWSGWRLLRGRDGALRNLLLVVWFLVYFGWLGRNWVATMRYFLPLYPAMALLAAWLLVELLRRTQTMPFRRLLAGGLAAFVVGFTLLWAGMFTNIYRHQLTRVQASHWFWEQAPSDFAMRIDGAGPEAPLINIPVANGPGGSNDLQAQASTHFAGQMFSYTFTAPATGLVSSVYAPHLGDASDSPDVETMRFAIETSDGGAILGQAVLSTDLTRENHPLGDAYTIPLDAPVELLQGQRYRFRFEVISGGPVLSGGSVVSHEGGWDDPIPYTVCTLPEGITLADNPPPGLSNAQNCNGRNAWSSLIVGYDMGMAVEDERGKRDHLIRVLRDSDYLTISSNRFYDSQSRIPARWPMTNAYYDKLFAGELGFELAEVFQETFELGPLRVSDQHLPIYSSPKWLNEFEAEEAFHVYDHPVVFVFRKSADYDHRAVENFFHSIPLNRPTAAGSGIVDNCPRIMAQPGGGGCDVTLIDTLTLSSLQADAAPTQLMFTPDRREIQETNASWYERFDRDSLINAQPVITVVVWWLAIMTFGWVTWPLLFALFPGLADRGFAVAKLAGMMLAGWATWAAAAAGLALWSQAGIALAMILLALVSLIVALRHRAAFAQYVRQYWRRLALIECITLLAFLGFLFVRLTNPDLWHTAFGGEKPMDFAYFNGVLRSTIFPAIDPWYAGGYLNYYYFGYVLVGVPVLLLKVVPSIAYNLILPTLFALTGIGAFAVAFNLVHHWQERRRSFADEPGDAPGRRRMGNPWIAGIVALLLAVVLGNLDTPRVFGNGLAQLGGYSQPQGLYEFLINEQLEASGTLDPAVEFDLRQRAEQNHLSDRLRYEIHNSTSLISGLVGGVGELIKGQTLPIGSNRWYWAPSRVLAETPGVEGNAITEMPYFTFLYGDLHAHMIAMPMLLFVMVFLLNEVFSAGQDKRSGLLQFLALALGAMFTGLLRATNTWDWPTFTLLSVVGLGFAWWLAWGRINRQTLLNLALRVGGFIALSFVFALPYTSWYAAIYNRVLPWQGGKTPLWAYFDIHGLFLFLLFGLLVWDTTRWFRSVYVRDLRGLWPLLVALAGALLAILVGAVFLAMVEYQVALVAIPLLVWMAVLFLRPDQSRAVQFVLLLAGLALGLTLGVEFIVLDGDIGRQNTVFKFYIQAWLLFSVMGGAAFAWLYESSANWRTSVRSVWMAAAALLFAVAALFPVMSTRARALDRMAPEMPATLDGMEYMRYAMYFENDTQIPLADDYHMIRWLQDHVHGTPTIIESHSWREYLWQGRVAIYTGMPTVLGWRFHQTQQRTFEGMGALIAQRRANINGFYSTTSVDDALRIIRFYGIQYIIVGGLERAYYPTEGLMKFEEMTAAGLLEKVYEEGRSTVYKVADAAHDLQVMG